MTGRRLQLVAADPSSAAGEADEIAVRAAKAGYRLKRAVEPPFGPDGWHLLDADDGMRIYSACALDQITAWLDT